jgi:hypothetical protein
MEEDDMSYLFYFYFIKKKRSLVIFKKETSRTKFSSPETSKAFSLEPGFLCKSKHLSLTIMLTLPFFYIFYCSKILFFNEKITIIFKEYNSVLLNKINDIVSNYFINNYI